MKKLLFFLTCVIISATTLAQNYDSVITDNWSGGVWVHSSEELITYDAQCRPASYLSRLWQPGTSEWKNAVLTTLSYTAAGQQQQSTTQIWNTSKSRWDNSTRFTYSFNAANFLDSSIAENWSSRNWKNSSLFITTYNADTTISQVVSKTAAGSAWNNFSRTTFTYYPDKTRHETISEVWNGSAWVFNYRNAVTYTATGKIDSSLSQLRMQNQWQNAALSTNMYDGNGNRTNVLNQNWDTGSSDWVNADQTTYTYDGNGHLINELYQFWNSGSSSWTNFNQTNYTNNSDGTVAQTVRQQWNGAWTNEERTTYTYSACNILPLTLLNFTASKDGSNALLNWQTTNEKNTSHFTIQRSLNGIGFTDIARVNANGANSAANKYNYTDNLAGVRTGTVYYRLQMADKDGKATTSKIVSLNISGNGIDYSIKPNPAHSFFVLSTSSEHSIVTIASLSGQVVLKQNLATPGEHRLNISSLAAGMYAVSIATSQGITTQKLVIK